ncbi:MAG: hypothetical protein K9J43_01045, partial [Polynucleobacter sp.]|nr:hypothetical protein [Polynucleobacter sp.]
MSQDLAAAWDGFQTSLDAAGETVANDFLNFAMGLSESIEGIPESLLDQYNDMLAAQDGLVAILDAAGNSAEKQFLNLAIGLSDALSSTGESVLVSLSDLARALGNAMDGVNPWLQVFEFVSGTDPSLGGLINAVQGGFGAAEQTYSPLILDLDGDGVETLGQQSIIHFDHDKNGFSELTGWVGKDDGLLVLDRNGNGQIDDGGELFGNNTILANGSLASNGYKALMELDANQDGSIDISDSAYSTLRVWKDGNSDGAVDDGELMTLEQAGVESISTGYSSRPAHFDDFGNWVPNNPDDIDIYGNEHRQIGSFTKVGGSSGNTADVWFNVDMARTVDKDLITISAEIEALPEVAGFGNVHGLRQAMQRDTSGELKTLVSQLENETDFDVQYQLTSQILYHWAGVQGEDPNSRGIYLAGEALKLYTLEKFVGKEFVLLENVSSDTEGPIGAAVVRDTFSQLAFWAYSQIMTQTHFKPLLDSISLTANSDGSIGWGMSGVSDSLHSRYDTDPVEGMRYAALFVATLQSVIGSETNPVLDALRAEGNPNGTGFDLFLANLGPNVDYLGNNSSPISGSGDDVLFGLWGDDSLNGGAGDDQLFGDVGNDLLMGGQGDDQLYGHIGNDRLIGEEGN